MAQRSGWEWRAKINGVFYAGKRYRYADTVPGHNVSNTEGKPGNPLFTTTLGTSAVIAGLPKGQWMLQSATFDEDDSPFSAPLQLIAGTYVTIILYPAGVAEVPFTMQGMVTSAVLEGDVDGVQPVTLEGESDGVYDMS